MRSLLYYVVTGAVIAAFAFINQYPLVYSDSGAYIDNSRTLEAYDDRPIGYGLIIRAVTWQASMWPVVLFQGAVASWLLMLLLRELISDERRWRHLHLLLIAFLMLFSSLPWYAAQIMADHYTPLLVLIAFLLFKGSRLGPWREGGLWLLLFFFLTTHNAHLPMAGVLSVLLLLGALRAARERGSRAFWMRWVAFNACVAGAALLIMSFNYARHGRMQLSRAGNVFLTGRLCDPGIMADYLKEKCAASDHPFCAYKDRLPEDAGDLLWSADEFVNAEHLTIGQADSILAPLVAEVLSEPKYLVRFARSVLTSTVVQLFQFDVGAGLIPYGPGSSPYHNLQGKIPEEWNGFSNARQNWGHWQANTDANQRGAFALLISLLLLALHFFGPAEGVTDGTLVLVKWVLLWIVLNAAVTSAFSVIDPRLQARVMWLLPMTAFLLAVQVRSWRSFLRLRPDVSDR